MRVSTAKQRYYAQGLVEIVEYKIVVNGEWVKKSFTLNEFESECQKQYDKYVRAVKSAIKTRNRTKVGKVFDGYYNGVAYRYLKDNFVNHFRHGCAYGLFNDAWDKWQEKFDDVWFEYQSEFVATKKKG